MKEFDVMVLGGSLAGVSAALRAAELGGKVCLVEKDVVGVASFHRRNTLHIENHQAVEASTGWEDYKEILKSETESYTNSLKEKLDALGVSVIEGEGELVSPNQLNVKKSDGEFLLVNGKSVILAFGSDPRFPSTLPHEPGVVISIDDIAGQQTLPEKVMVIGGGSVASETAVGLQRRGCKVFLCVEKNEIFPEMDEDFNVEIERQLKDKKIKILAGKKLISFYKNEQDLEITLETGVKFTVQQIIIAEDRVGIPANVTYEKLGIRLGEHNKIFIDDGMMTSLPGVYAVGSVAGELASDTLAQEGGKVAAENAMGKKRKLNLEWVPQSARLFPNVSYVGCTMKSAGFQGFHPVEGVFELDSVAKENLLDSSSKERYKVVADKRSRLIVGAQIISSQSGDWVSMLLLLIKKGVTVVNLANSVTPEGSKFKGLSEAARNCLRALKS